MITVIVRSKDGMERSIEIGEDDTFDIEADKKDVSRAIVLLLFAQWRLKQPK